MISVERKARIKWQCRRGMLELDLILSQFMAEKFDSLSSSQVAAFENLLNAQDPDLYVWLIGQEPPQKKELLQIVNAILLCNQT